MAPLRLSRRSNRLALIAQIQRDADRQAALRQPQEFPIETGSTSAAAQACQAAAPADVIMSDPVEFDEPIASVEDDGHGFDDDENGDDFVDRPDFMTDFGDVELNQQLQDIRVGTEFIFDAIDGDINPTAQDEDVPTIDELLDLVGYQDNDAIDPTADVVSDDEDEDQDNPQQPETDEPMLPQCGKLRDARKTPPSAEDTSTEVPHRRKYSRLSDLHMALGIWAQLAGLSDKDWRTLRNILQNLVKPDTLSELANLPAGVGTLKKHVKERLPLLETRTAPVTLAAEKISSMRTRRTGEVATQDLYFFNPVSYFHTLLSSKIKDNMYFGPAQLIDSPCEPWHSNAWASSTRTTSGNFARYPTGGPIFPSDFVKYYCHRENCPTCSELYHLGQVREVWRDYRAKPLTTSGAWVLVIEPMAALARTMAALSLHKNNSHNFPQTEPLHNEYVLVENFVTEVEEDKILGIIDGVFVDYSFGSSVTEGIDIEENIPGDAVYIVRRKLNSKLRRFFPVVKSTPIRGELEIQEFTRQALVDTLDRKDVDVLTVPIILFADGFGLYRTMHKSIMGIYHSIAALPRSERLKQMNVMPLTLGPHGSNDEDVWELIGGKLRELEEGADVNLHGKLSFVSAFVYTLVGDFPQQQDNSGFRRPTAKQGCRMCTVTLTDRGNLEFDLSSGEHQRYHHEIMRQRKYLRSLTTRARIESAANAWGLAIPDPALTSIVPALDITKTRPADAAHSEYGGLTKMLHLLIIDQVLTPKGNTEYAKLLRLFPAMPGWRPVQSPHHVLQYSLVEHAQWSVMMPLLARTWLKSHPSHVKAAFSKMIMSAFAEDIRDGLFGPDPEPVDIIVKVLVENVRTNVQLTASYLQDRDREKFFNQIKLSRRLFQQFCQAASAATSSRRRSKSVESVSAPHIPTVASNPAVIESGPAAVSYAIGIQDVEDIENPALAMEPIELTTAKASKYKLWMSRPNVHIGLHYGDVMDEYGLVSIAMVIVFELKHKSWKKVVYTTNHRSPEKDLFAWENFLQSIRFVLLDAFSESDPDLTQQMKILHETIPSLFTSVLRGHDTLPQAATNFPIGEPWAVAPDDEADLTARFGVKLGDAMDDVEHEDVVVSGRLKPSVVREARLPQKESDLKGLVAGLLEKSYHRDYNRMVTTMGTGQRLRWWKRVSWLDRVSGKRVSKERGEYIEYKEGEVVQCARLDHILVHEATQGQGQYRVFLLITPVENPALPRIDHLTGLAIKRHINPTIIGLPCLRKTQLYMFPFIEHHDLWDVALDAKNIDARQLSLLQVDWPVGLM